LATPFEETRVFKPRKPCADPEFAHRATPLA
jgi:hypothetical protein